MLRKSYLFLVFVCAGLVASSAEAAEKLPPQSDCLPANAFLALQITHPEKILDVVLDQRVLEAIQASPAYKKQAGKADFQGLLLGVKFGEFHLGTDWKTALRKLTGGGISLAVAPGGESLLIIDSTEAALLNKLHDFLTNVMRGEAKKKGVPDPVVSKKIGDVTVWSFGGEEAHVLIDGRLIIGSRENILRAALDLKAGKGQSLSSQTSYQAAREAVGKDAVGMLYLDLATLKKAPQLREALGSMQNPWGVLLFGSLLDAVKGSSWMALGLGVAKDRLALDAYFDGKAGTSEAATFTLPKKGEGALPNVAVPRQIAGLSLFRDLRAFYTAKDKLFPERTSGLIFFENMMGIFFSGRNLTDEVFAETRPEIRFVVAGQTYDTAFGTPQVQLPAFALIIPVRHPKEFTEVAEEAWQKMVGLVSFVSGQKGQSGMIIDRDRHDGVRYSVSRYTRPRGTPPKHVPVQFNFSPAMAMVEDSLVFSTTEELVKDLIDGLKKQKVQPLAGTNTSVELDGAKLGSLLAANRTNLVLQNIVEKGNSREQAEADIDGFLSLVRMLESTRLTVGERNGKAHLGIEAKIHLP